MDLNSYSVFVRHIDLLCELKVMDKSLFGFLRVQMVTFTYV